MLSQPYPLYQFGPPAYKVLERRTDEVRVEPLWVLPPERQADGQAHQEGEAERGGGEPQVGEVVQAKVGVPRAMEEKGALHYPVVPKFSPVAFLSQIAGIFFSLS